MSAEVISRNADLKRLRDEGYELEIREGCAIVSDVPYLDESGVVQKGTLVSQLNVNGTEVLYQRNCGGHVIYFQGSKPYRKNGAPLSAVINSPVTQTLAGITVNWLFSNKPANDYADYYEKFLGYIRLLSAEAQAVDLEVTAATFKKVDSTEDSVFCYMDTNASRAAITDCNDKLKSHKIGIIGLGGTGSYILDQLAKTPVAEIHVFDGDRFLQHNAFRAPGAPDGTVFDLQPHKVEYFSSIYRHMHRHIVPHPYFLDEDNVQELASLDFVFIAMDSGESKRTIISFLCEQGIGFIDTGIDIRRCESALLGTTRATLCEHGNHEVIEKNISFAQADQGLYQSNIQTAELNAFCALSAVIQWKKILGFYHTASHMVNGVYDTMDGEFKWS